MSKLLRLFLTLLFLLASFCSAVLGARAAASEGEPAVRALEPGAESVIPTQAIFEVSLHGTLDPATVTAKTVVLYDLDSGEVVRTIANLRTGLNRTLLTIAPEHELRHGHAHLLTLDRAIATREGERLSSSVEAKYMTAPARCPRILFTPEELALVKRHVLAYENPWRSAYDNIKAEVDREAMTGAPAPVRGAPDPQHFDDCFNQWMRDMRYAFYLSLVANVTEDRTYLERARDYVTSWAGEFSPEPSRNWQVSIKYDLAGLLMVFACDLIAARDGLNPVEHQAVERFFVKLAAAVRSQHEAGNDSSTEPAGCYVKAWDDALLIALGLVLDWPQAIDYARDAKANPYSFAHQLEHAITSDGRIVDEYRGEEKEHYRVTYPLYHLQGLSLCAELLRHRCENHFRDLNSKGAGLLCAYEHYLPFVSGSLLVDWPDEDTRIHYGIAKFTPALTAYHMGSTYELLSQHEPLWDPHLMKKAASLVGRLPADLIRADRVAPDPPRDVRLGKAWATGILLTWEPPRVANEGDLVLRYLVYRNDELIATTTDTVFVDRSLEPETGYRYELRAADRAENVSAGATRIYYTRALP